MRSVLLIAVVIALLYVAYLQVNSSKSVLAPTEADVKNKMEQAQKQVDKIQDEHMKKLEKAVP